jgi:hypothetical protein
MLKGTSPSKSKTLENGTLEGDLLLRLQAACFALILAAASSFDFCISEPLFAFLLFYCSNTSRLSVYNIPSSRLSGQPNRITRAHLSSLLL